MQSGCWSWERVCYKSTVLDYSNRYVYYNAIEVLQSSCFSFCCIVSEDVSAVPTKLTLEDVAIRGGIKCLDVLNQQCSQDVLLSLANHCVDWQLIGFHLKLTKGDIAAVDGDFRTVDEKRIGMLGRWKERLAFKATYGMFIEALLSCGKASDAIEVCKAIVSSK